MKKGLSLILALMLAVFFVQGLAAADAKTVTVWCWDPNFNGYSMKEAAAVYNKTNPAVKIDIVDIPENIEGKITAGLQAGGAGLPDIALFQDFRIEQFIQDYPGAFVDLKAAGVDYSKFAQYKVGPMSEKGKIYGIPFDTGSTGLWLRADMIKKAGLNPDSYQKNMNWTQVTALGTTLKSKIAKPLISYDTTSFDFLRIMVQSTGSQFFNPDGSLNIKTDAVKKSLTILKDMWDKGLLYGTEGWNNWISALNNGDTAGFMNAIWMVGTIKSKPENKGAWMVVPTPILEGVKGAQNASNNGGSSWYVFSSSPNKAAAIDFLKATWASSAKDALAFYNTILKGAGAMGTYLPSRTGSNYTAKDEFFYKSQAVFKDFSTWMEKVPALMYTANYSTMRDAIQHATLLLFKGELKTVDAAIAAAETEYKQTSGM
jgi:lactose/L-arabinose transport system substrate-binding protein